MGDIHSHGAELAAEKDELRQRAMDELDRGIINILPLKGPDPGYDEVEIGGAVLKIPLDLDVETRNRLIDALRPTDPPGDVISSGDDPVNHPPHYTAHPSGIECIEVTRHMNFNLGNATKYIWRAGLKGDNPIQDLEKAKWYLDDEIKRLQKAVESD